MIDFLRRFLEEKKLLEDPGYRILPIDRNLTAFGEWNAGQDSWDISYLYQGVHGNYLLGTPLQLDTFREQLTLRGGVKAVFINQASHRRTAEELFRFTGCYYVAKERYPWEMPGYENEKIYHHDFKSDFDHGGWQFETPREYFLYGKNTYKPGAKSKAIRHLPARIPGARLNDRHIHSYKAYLTASKRLARLFTENRILFYQHPELPLIAVFDDIEFERNDYEVIGPKARWQLQKVLTELEFTRQIRAETFALDGIVVQLSPRPRSLASELADGMILEQTKIYLCTPTQYWHLLLNQPIEPSLRDQIALEMAKTLPFNFPKVKSVTAATLDPSLIQEVQTHQRLVKVHFRAAKPKGIIGRRYKPE